MDAEQHYILDRNVIMILKSSIETIVSKLGYPSISHMFVNYFTDSQFDIASNTRISSDCILRGDIDLSNKTRLASKCKLEGNISIGRRTNLEPDCEVIGNVSIGNFCAIARRNLVALLNARQRRGRVDFAQSHSVRAEFLTPEDAVVVTHGGC